MEKLNFSAKKRMLRDLKIKVTQRTPTVDCFQYFVPPVSDAEWAQIARHGRKQYVGGCCGQSSAIQDIIQDWYRQGGAVPIQQLAEVAEMSIRHDHQRSPFREITLSWDEIRVDKRFPRISTSVVDHTWSNLWFRFAIVWHIVKDCYDMDVPSAIRTNMAPLDQAICTIDSVARAINFHRVFGDPNPNPATKAYRATLLARFTPALRMVMNHVDELSLGVVDGWAIIDLDKGSESVCENNYGLCVYESRSDCTDILDAWFANQTAQAMSRKYGVRQVSIDTSRETGLKFTSPIEPYTAFTASSFDRLFAMTPEELGQAAVDAVRKQT